MADALAALQKPAVKPSLNGKVDATEPSGLSKTGASTMAFAVAAVLLLAAGAAMVGGAGAPSKARAAIPRFWHVGMAAAEKSVAAIILRRHVVTTDCMGRLMRTGCSREPPSRPHFSLLRESRSQNSQIRAVFVGFSLVSASFESAGLVAARASSRKGPVSGLRDGTFSGCGGNRHDGDPVIARRPPPVGGELSRSDWGGQTCCRAQKARRNQCEYWFRRAFALSANARQTLRAYAITGCPARPWRWRP